MTLLATSMFSSFEFDHNKKVIFERLDRPNIHLFFMGAWNNPQVNLVVRFVALHFDLSKNYTKSETKQEKGRLVTLQVKNWNFQKTVDFHAFNAMLRTLNSRLHDQDYHWMTITQAAVVTPTNLVISAAPPAHHFELIRRVKLSGGFVDEGVEDLNRVGFIDSASRFVDCDHARDIAESAYQVLPTGHDPVPPLDSRDLW